MTERTKLIGDEGFLCTPDGEPVILIYPEGDCDSFDWPLRGDEVTICGKLARALYDMRESGQINNADGVILPDGVEFDISYWLDKREAVRTAQLGAALQADGFIDDDPGEDLTNEFPNGEFPIVGVNYFPNGY